MVRERLPLLVGVEIADSEGRLISHEEKVRAHPIISPHHAAHCGGIDAGSYCAYLTSRQGADSDILCHAALLCDANGGRGDACPCAGSEP
jgi:hypothetical protein